jgi:DtxR family Mn-dependent transcriptional regulator
MKSLTPNMEMYLKTIFEIDDAGSRARVKAIAERLGVTMPSVSGAVDNLQKRGLVQHNPYGDVKLTTKGRRVAREVKDRNETIYRFLLDCLHLPETVASRDACVLEHVVSPRTLQSMASFLEFRESNQSAVDAIMAEFAEFLEMQQHETVEGGS